MVSSQMFDKNKKALRYGSTFCENVGMFWSKLFRVLIFQEFTPVAQVGNNL